MDLHEDALNKIMGDMDDLESNKISPKGGATITITVSGGDSSDEGGDTGAGDLPADHDISMCGGGCAMHGGGEASTDAEDLPGDMLHMATGGTVLEQLEPDHDALSCKGLCPAHKGEKQGGIGKKGLSMASGGQVPSTPVPAEVDDMRMPPFLRKKKVG